MAGASIAPPPPPERPVFSAEVRLAADPSPLNIPINLIQDIINIPYNQVQAINLLGESLLFSGTWILPSSTNLFGTDSGDLGHYHGVINLLFPFPAFSNALGAQIVGLAQVLLPINSGCNNVGCPSEASLRAGYFQPARIQTLLTTGQYTFDDTLVTYPDGTQHPPEGLWAYGGPVTWGADYGHPEWNTSTAPNGDPVMPWAGTTFTLDLMSPFTNYLTHLMSDPTSPENTIKFPTLEQIGTAFTNLAQGLFVAFSPFFPGSPWCLGLCGPTVGPDSALGPPFYQGPPPLDPDWFHLPPVTTTASLNQNSEPVSVNAVSIPQSSSVRHSEAEQSAAGQQDSRIQQNDAIQNDAIQNVVVNLSTATSVGEPPALQQVPQTGAAQAGQQPHTAQTTNGTSNQSPTTSTNRPNVAKKPTVTDDGSKFEPPQVSGNDAARGRSAGAPNATLDQSGSSRSANPSEASGSAASAQPTGSEN